MNKRQIEKFLGYFGQPIICYSLENARASKMVNHSSLDVALAMNKKGSDVYFYVNSGGTKKEEIQFINSCFVDLDAGRDKNGKYLSSNLVSKKKLLMKKKWKTFPIQPTLVVETRNGYHLYWVLSKPIIVKLNPFEVNQWNTIQTKINNFFADVGADAKVKKLNQIMRVPGTLWQKTWENHKDKHLTKLLEHNPINKVTLTQLINALKNVSGTQQNKTTYSRQSRTYVQTSTKSNYNSPKIIVNDCSPKTTNIKSNVLIDTVAFLREIAPQLFYKGLQYSSNQARKLADEISKEYCIS